MSEKCICIRILEKQTDYIQKSLWDSSLWYQVGEYQIHAWDGDAWLEEKWKRDQEHLKNGETPRGWFW